MILSHNLSLSSDVIKKKMQNYWNYSDFLVVVGKEGQKNSIERIRISKRAQNEAKGQLRVFHRRKVQTGKIML